MWVVGLGEGLACGEERGDGATTEPNRRGGERESANGGRTMDLRGYE